MSDYISREAAEAVFRNARKTLNAQKYDYMASEYLTRDTMLLNAEQIIHALPAADVREVKRGKWERKEGAGMKLLIATAAAALCATIWCCCVAASHDDDVNGRG